MKKSAKTTQRGQAEVVPVRLPGLDVMRAGLHALVVTAGLEMVGAMLERDRTTRNNMGCHGLMRASRS